MGLSRVVADGKAVILSQAPPQVDGAGNGRCVMELAGDYFSGLFIGWAWFGYVLVMLLALRLLPWRRLLDGRLFNVYFGSCVALLMLWTVNAEVNAGLSFHLLGVTVLTLMFGWSLAVIGSSLALVGATLNTGQGGDLFALNAFTTGIFPVTLSQISLVLVRSLLPKNFFIYVLVNGFLTAGLVALVSGYLVVGLLVYSGGFSLPQLEEGFMPYFPLMFLPEAMLNGWIITILVLYRPAWVYSFSDELYLKGK
jgi:uncharacterized membrane protein